MRSSVQSKTRRKARLIPKQIDLAALGNGELSYIRQVSAEKAREEFPSIEKMPKDIDLYVLHGADGTPLALTDTKQAAIGYAMGGDLEIRMLH